MFDVDPVNKVVIGTINPYLEESGNMEDNNIYYADRAQMLNSQRDIFYNQANSWKVVYYGSKLSRYPLTS